MKKLKQKKESAFEKYLQTLTAAQTEKVSAFFTELECHVLIPRDEKLAMRSDFEAALLYYASTGIILNDALSRLDISNLGGFYARPASLWYPLDDAAKVYPLSMKHGQMAVFRLSVYLKEPVVPEILQIALSFTIKRFPSFATTVKKGFFWHYLDTAKRRYSIEPETEMPCRPLMISKSGSQSFRVQYYNNRISAEYFHILTDGSGGMVFLKTLTAEYLRLLGTDSPNECGIPDINAAPTPGEIANEFPRAEGTEKASGFAGKASLQLSGNLSRMMPCRIIHYKMDAKSLSAAASRNGVTVTAYLLAIMFIAARHAIDSLDGNVVMQVPVNMRKFYPSDTLRNFSMYCGVKFPIGEITDIESMAGEIKRQLTENASKDAMSEMMNATERMVNTVRYIPLVIKAPVAKLIYGFLGDRLFCSTLSNLGVIEMPGELERHIESMDFVLGTALTNRASCSLVTFGGTATLSVSKMTADPSFEEAIAALLEKEGIPTIIEGSGLYDS